MRHVSAEWTRMLTQTILWGERLVVCVWCMRTGKFYIWKSQQELPESLFPDLNRAQGRTPTSEPVFLSSDNKPPGSEGRSKNKQFQFVAVCLLLAFNLSHIIHRSPSLKSLELNCGNADACFNLCPCCFALQQILSMFSNVDIFTRQASRIQSACL